MTVLVCEQCKRLYLEKSKASSVVEMLSNIDVRLYLYDIDYVAGYLASIMPVHVFSDDEKLYVPNMWVERQPQCPLHDSILFEVPCEKNFKKRTVKFKGFYCDQCDKIIVRKIDSYDILEKCAVSGVPEIEVEQLEKQQMLKKMVSTRSITIDYIVENGKRYNSNRKLPENCVRLTEDDLVVVSDSLSCSLEGHITEGILTAINITEKKNGKKVYLFKTGYCISCQKYYMDEMDFKAFSSRGRADVSIMTDLEDDSYMITSGESFNKERQHLNSLEDIIQNKIDNIHSQSDYYDPHQVVKGGFDDNHTQLQFAKKRSKDKYGERLQELNSYKYQPYKYRVDIKNDNNYRSIYIGQDDINIDGEQYVVSINSDYGRKLINYRSRIIKDPVSNEKYNINLSREFDIVEKILYGYINLKSVDDPAFRSGATDPFLIRVLKTRRKQHNITDIITTIQEHQNEIVDAKFDRNSIVQGCAGSGKTMVMLHRLASLNYNHKEFDFREKAVILTPNDQFGLFIKGVAEGLNIGNITRISIERYYRDELRKYSDEFKYPTKLSSDFSRKVDRKFLEFVYSDDYKNRMKQSYNAVIKTRNTLAPIVNKVAFLLGCKETVFDMSDDSKVPYQIEYAIEALEDAISTQERVLDNKTSEISKLISRKEYLEKVLVSDSKKAQNIKTGLLPSVYAQIESYVYARQMRIESIERDINDSLNEIKRIEDSFIMFNKKDKLQAAINKNQKATRDKEEEVERQYEEDELFNLSLAGKSDEEILEWISQIYMLYIPELKKDCDSWIKLYKTYTDNSEELESVKDRINILEKEYQHLLSGRYSDELKRIVKQLKNIISQYTLLGTYQKVFDNTVSDFVKKNKIVIEGKNHRYDLYSELLFAIMYFKVVHGTDEFMCVDEGQDISLNEYRLLKAINHNRLIVNIYGDTNQLLDNSRGISDWSELKETLNADQYFLQENYRNTNQITNFCNKTFDMNVLRTGVDGAEIKEIRRIELEDELNKVRINDNRIAILIPEGYQKKAYLKKDKLNSDIESKLNYEVTIDSFNGFISVMYVSEVKGLEFDRVYVLSEGMSINEKYIAYTRALSVLINVIDPKAKVVPVVSNVEESEENDNSEANTMSDESELKAITEMIDALEENAKKQGENSIGDTYYEEMYEKWVIDNMMTNM